MPGVIGQLFHEFAVIVSLAIVVSAFVSLTLVPMLANRFLKPEVCTKSGAKWMHAITHSFERMFDSSLRSYTRGLDLALKHRKSVLFWPLADFHRYRVYVHDDPKKASSRRRYWSNQRLV